MPTRAEVPTQDSNSWTDALPVCRLSGIGYSTNQIYREDGYRQEEHPFEDTSFHWQLDENTYLYGVFDGHEGIETAMFALQTMAYEITFGQLSDKQTDEEIREVLRQAFISVEKSYSLSIGDTLAERTCVKEEIPDGLTSYEAYQKYPHLVDKLKRLNGELSSGTTAVIALIRNNRLFVANVGDSRALLCRTDENRVMKVVQLSCDHNLSNEDELLRLYNLGLEKLTPGSRLGNQDNTRCLGNHLVKVEYKEFEELACATAEPIIAEPEINGGIELDESCRFLLLMSDGLYKSLEESGVSEDQVNKEIARLTVSEFRMQATLMGVAQAVVDRVVRVHHDVYMRGVPEAGATRRDDITLLVRNFNYPLPNAITSPTHNVRFNPNPTIKTIPPLENSNFQTETNHSTGTEYTNSTSTSHGSDESSIQRVERIPAYVDFKEFFQNVEEARQKGTLPPGIDFGM
ncbi:TGF-beta-activated kinase 1 and MAP3K7-binding protein 1-like [Macrosteles quadrilineatus]|uniref:TGF-beta-activated kinase 1 and MAP3K7-binding protein 1-like n=1 Tax=Macrosteles quadrilineatus TaxID=74068 RepID=UPI0023E1357B|nr:TGF-beta-activated kinase 1 and MAP3K7-binding protein 1-like [Macrosteles quadrilineatus]